MFGPPGQQRWDTKVTADWLNAMVGDGKPYTFHKEILQRGLLSKMFTNAELNYMAQLLVKAAYLPWNEKTVESMQVEEACIECLHGRRSPTPRRLPTSSPALNSSEA